jgi:hypothetical protein
MAVYCRIGTSTIEIWGVDHHDNGYPLVTFKYADVHAAAPNPIVQTVQGQGSVALQVDYDDDFFLKWTGGPWGSDQLKWFKCRF